MLLNGVKDVVFEPQIHWCFQTQHDNLASLLEKVALIHPATFVTLHGPYHKSLLIDLQSKLLRRNKSVGD